MKDYNEIAHNVLERRDEYITRQKAKRKKITQITSVIGCFVLVAGIGFGMNMDKWTRTQIVDPNPIGGAVFPTAPLTTIQGNSTENLTTTFPITTPTTYSADNWTTSPTTEPNTEAFSTTAPITHPITTTVPPELYHEIDWSYKSTPGKFFAVILDSAKYGDVTIKSNKYSDFNEYVYPFTHTEEIATTRKATEFISDKPIEVFDNNGKSHKTTIDIFTLEGLSENLAIGVRFPDDDRIYTYINTWYIPETLGEFLDAIDYDNTVTYGGITLYPGNNFPVNDENFKDIKECLLSEADAANILNMAVTGKSVTATIYCRELGLENKGFNIYEDGYISTNLIGYEYVFYVGKEAVANFLKDSYNITFEQIKDIEMVTMNTTEPLYTSEPGTTINENAVTTVTTTWWCGTRME